MRENFIPRLNEFTELLKLAYARHAETIVELGDMQKELLDKNGKLREDLKALYDVKKYSDPQVANRLANLLTYTSCWRASVTEERQAFQLFIRRTNEQLGSFSSHWGSYLESLGVQYMLNSLKKDHGVHTSIQKFKRWWHKSRNVEIDLLALSDTHAYVVEVKNNLKEETFKQMLTVLDKIREKIPEYAHLRLQPVFVCMHAEEKIVQTSLMGGIWIVRYCGFDPDNPKDEFVWLRKDD